jgi:Zn-dependent peptidase ImmA (M78 family)
MRKPVPKLRMYEGNPPLKRYFTALNHKYFDSKLPEITEVVWATNLRKDYSYEGVVIKTKDLRPCIVIDRNLMKDPNRITLTLLHEMIHLKLLTYDPKGKQRHHGPMFQKEKLRLAAEGALQNIW